MLLSRDETFLLYFLAPEFPAEREPVVYLNVGSDRPRLASGLLFVYSLLVLLLLLWSVRPSVTRSLPPEDDVVM